MKKMIAVLLLLMLCGCTTLDLAFVSEESGAHQQDKQSEEIQLAKQITLNFEQGETTTQFTSDEKLQLDEVVKILSFLIPYDIQLKQRAFPFFTGIRNIFELEILEADVASSDALIDEAIQTYITDAMSQQEKIDVVHQFIIDHCEYDYRVKQRTETNKQAFQIGGVMAGKSAVCSGYARTFMRFMRKLSIPCLYVSSDKINHSFNLVYDDDYQFIDTTWDEVSDRYYNVSVDDFFADGNHQLEKRYNRQFFMNLLAYVYLLA